MNMGSEFLIAPSLSFSYVVLVSLVVLCCIFFYNHMFSKLQARMRFFRKLLLLGIGWNLCSLITVLPHPAYLDKHLFDSPLFLNVVFMAQSLFWLPFGYLVYRTFVIAFGKKPSSFLTVYTVSGIALYWALFFIGMFYPPIGFAPEVIGSFITIVAYFLFVVPPLLASGLNSLLWGVEAWEAQEKFYLFRTAAIFFLFGFLALGQDVFLPYIFQGGPDSLSFLKNTQVWASIFLLAFYQNIVPKIEYTQLQKIAFHVDQIINDGVLVYNETGRISFMNTAAPLLLHLPEDRLKKLFIQDIFPQLNLFDSCFRQPVLMIMNNTSRSFQVSIVREAFWYGSKHYLLIFSDVTAEHSVLRKYESFKEKMLQQQMQSQQQILKVYEESRGKERLLQVLIDNLPFRIAVKNSSGTYILQNEPDKKALGDLYGTLHDESNLSDVEKEARLGKVGHYDRIEYKEDVPGEIRIAEHFTYLPVLMEHGNYYIIRLARDMTEILKMENERSRFREQELQRSRLEELGALAGGIAHDFNNILGAQQGFCELAISTVKEDSRTHRYLQEIMKASSRAKELIKQMLTDVRQLKVSNKKESFRLAILLQDLITQVRLTLPPNITIVSGTSDANLFLTGSDTDLFRVLQNLISNGVYAMREAGGELRIYVESVDIKEPLQEGLSQVIMPGSYAKIDVSDTGSGIKGSEIQRIFSPFFTTKAPGEGFGLGLSSSLNLVRQVKGEITVQSVLGKGTTFSVYWPMITQNEGDDYGKSASN